MNVRNLYVFRGVLVILMSDDDEADIFIYLFPNGYCCSMGTAGNGYRGNDSCTYCRYGYGRYGWIELGYGYTLWKMHKNKNPKREIGFYSKDRYFSVKLQLLREGSWWPSLAVGGNDVFGSRDGGESASNYYRNYFVAASKHIDCGGHVLGAHVAYRKWKRDFNHKWYGVVGGVTYQPSFYTPLRAMAEWDGNGVNVGVDCRIYKYFLIQCGLQECQHFTGGLTLCIGLL